MASDIHGDLTDDEVYVNLIAAMDADHPKLILVNFPSVDRAGHAGNRDDYLSAITNVDNLIYQLWYKIANDPYYKNTTTLFITNDHGRHTTDFSSHGDDCEGCRHLMLLALGRKIIPGKIVSEKKYQTALAPTIGELLSFTTTGAGDSSLFDASYLPATEMKYLTYHLIDSDVILNWETKIEINNYGFEVERSQNSMITKLQDWKSNGSQNPNWVKVGFVDGNGSSNLMNDYSFVDKSVPSGRYYYRLKQIDDDRKYRFSKQVEVVINKLPAYFLLVQNYPNPFNPITTIEFAIPSANIVQVKVFNILGMEVATLLNELKQAGKHRVEFDAGNLASGIYFYKVVSGDNLETKKMILLK
ncbi:MAG: T9SS type A sorting domain-containing protein [Ignavibacteria bacterium]|nr:T9SS type A sorting domain-containing protein [Ignavibacteria bacterium]